MSDSRLDAIKSISPFLDTIKDLYNLKKTETYMPINNCSAWCVPASISADLALRTGVVSPVEFERQLSEILFEHTFFRTPDGREYQPKGESFFQQVSIYDRTALLWGFEKATYGDLIKDREIYCPKSNCNQEQKITVTLDELINDDSYTIWDQHDEKTGKLIPFFKYRKDYVLEDNDIEYVFRARIPSIYDNNEVMKRIDSKTLQERLRNGEPNYSDIDYTILNTSGLGLRSKTGKFENIFTENVDEIRLSLEKYFPAQILREFLKLYNDDFKKYTPKFYSKRECPHCGHRFKLHVDLEVEIYFRIMAEKNRRDLSDITDSINWYTNDSNTANDTSDSIDIIPSNSENIFSLFNEEEINQTETVENISSEEDKNDNSEQVSENNDVEISKEEVIDIKESIIIEDVSSSPQQISLSNKRRPKIVEDENVDKVVKI
jgi:hypothetical protein